MKQSQLNVENSIKIFRNVLYYVNIPSSSVTSMSIMEGSFRFVPLGLLRENLRIWSSSRAISSSLKVMVKFFSCIFRSSIAWNTTVLTVLPIDVSFVKAIAKYVK